MTLLVGIVLALNAAATSRPPDALSERIGGDSKTPWQFNCDEFRGFGKEKRSVCRGHVVVTRDDVRVTCDLFEMHQDEKWGPKRLFCLENVVFVSKEGRATAEKAEFDNLNQQLVLTGNPILYQGGNVIHGETILYNRKGERFTVKKIRAKLDAKAANQPAPAPVKPEARKE